MKTNPSSIPDKKFFYEALVNMDRDEEGEKTLSKKSPLQFSKTGC